MDVSIIIVNYKTPILTLNSVKSIFNFTTGIDFEVIVVDNDSRDNSVSLLKEKFGSEIQIIPSSENLGFGRANNLAAKVSKGGKLFFLNSDAYLIDNSIKLLSDYFSENNSVGIVGGNLYDEKLNPILSFENKLPSITGILLNPLLSKFGFVEYHNHSNSPKKVAYISGANLMIKKSLFDLVGGFNKNFFLYFEETELTYRLKELGYHSFSIPSSKFIHLGGSSNFQNDENDSFNLPSSQYLKSKYIYFLITKGKKSLFKVYISSQLLNLSQIYKSLQYAKSRIVLEKTIYKSIKSYEVI